MKVDEKDKAFSHETPTFLYQVSQAMMLHICEHGGRNSGNTTRGCLSLPCNPEVFVVVKITCSQQFCIRHLI